MPEPCSPLKLNALFRRVGRRCQAAVIALLTCVGLAGCGATLNETYYLATHDPDTRATNYFRVTLAGSAELSSVKFSVGFYDRAAVERLFGETAIEREYRATRVELFGADGQRLRDLSAQLTAIEQQVPALRKEQLDRANSALAELIGRYRVRLLGYSKNTELLQALDTASRLRTEAEAKIVSNQVGDLIIASAKLREAQGYLEAIRIVVDSRVLVRFFDGGGNEIDVASKTQVIFVASDASRFLEAIRQLAESEQAQQDVLRIVLGPQIKEARRLSAKATGAGQENTALRQKIVAGLPEIEAATTLPQLQALIRGTANSAAGTSVDLKTGNDIREYLRGLKSP